MRRQTCVFAPPVPILSYCRINNSKASCLFWDRATRILSFQNFHSIAFIHIANIISGQSYICETLEKEEKKHEKWHAEMDGDARLPRTTHSHIQLTGIQIHTTIMTRTAQNIAAAVTGRVERLRVETRTKSWVGYVHMMTYEIRRGWFFTLLARAWNRRQFFEIVVL